MTEIFDTPASAPKPENVSYRSSATQVALVISLIGVFLGLINYLTGVDKIMLTNSAVKWGVSLLSIGIGAYFTFMGLKKHRDKDLGGYLTVGRSIGYGVWVGLIAGLITAVWTYIFMTWIAPDFLDTVRNISMQEMAKQGQSEEQIEMAMPFVEKFISPAAMAFFGFIGSIVTYLIVGLVCGLVLKRE